MSQVWSNTGSKGVMRPGGIGNKKAFSTKIKNKINFKRRYNTKKYINVLRLKRIYLIIRLLKQLSRKAPKSISRLFQSPGKYHD